MARASKQVAERAAQLFVSYDALGYDGRAFCSEELLSQAIKHEYDPWACCYDLVFRQNYRFPPSFGVDADFFAQRLNETQQKFIHVDLWWGRAMNGGADPLFSDPEPLFIQAWWSLDVIGWNSFEKEVRRHIETIMRVDAREVVASIEAHGLMEAGGVIKAKRLGDPMAALEEEDMTPQERGHFSQLEKLLFSKQEKFERKVLEAVWRLRERLIQPPAV